MINKIKKIAVRNLVNIPGWRTDRKIVVFESDDWGSIRMASKEAYNWFMEKGYHVDQCPYNKHDSIESNEDLELLFEVLTSVKDLHGNSAVFTANNIVANPDFKKIRETRFRQYYYEPFTETLKRYTNRDRVFELYKQGIAEHVFVPQFHGREHVNVNRWMSGLNSGNQVLIDAFEQEMFAVYQSGNLSGSRQNLDAFGMRYDKEWVNIKDVIQSGLDLFENIWGYRSLSFIAPCYVWPVEIEEILFEGGVKYLQGTHVQRIPYQNEKSGIKKRYHYQAQKNKFGQIYLVRNVSFEPVLEQSDDLVSKAMYEIGNAFKHKKPAIISSHRVNYVGSMNRQNRDRSLGMLKTLLSQIQEKWPAVEFMTSDELGGVIEKEREVLQ